MPAIPMQEVPSVCTEHNLSEGDRSVPESAQVKFINKFGVNKIWMQEVPSVCTEHSLSEGDRSVPESAQVKLVNKFGVTTLLEEPSNSPLQGGPACDQPGHNSNATFDPLLASVAPASTERPDQAAEEETCTTILTHCSVCLDCLGEGVTLAWNGGDIAEFTLFEKQVVMHTSKEKLSGASGAPSKIQLKCGHAFHCACAIKWLLGQGTCPNCRMKVIPEIAIPAEQRQIVDFLAGPTPARGGFWRNLAGAGGRQARTRDTNVRIQRREDDTIRLDFSGCRTANDAFIKPYVEKAGDKLVSLICPGIPITRTTVKYVYRNCPNIDTLDVSHCTLSRDVMIKLVQRCKFLRHLTLGYCKNVDDQILKHIAGAPFTQGTGLRHLVTLDLAYNKSITDKGVTTLQKCKHLTTLRLPYCTGVTDNGLSQLLPHLQSLKALSLRGNLHVSTRTMRCIASSVPSMERIDIVGCTRVDSQSSAGLLVQSLSNLTEFLSRDVILTSDTGNGVQGMRNRMVTRVR